MEGSLKILFVEDVIPDAELVWREMIKNKIGFTKLLVDNRIDYLEGLKSFIPDLIISDYSLPQFDGMTALSIRNELAPLTPFILITGSINEEVAVECMKAGADDYILKENLSRLGSAVFNSITKIKLLKEKIDAEEALRQSEIKYRNIFENVTDLYYETSMDGIILDVSPSIVQMSKGQYHREDLIDKSMYDFYSDPEERRSLLEVLKLNGSVNDFEISLINRDNTLIPCSISSKISFDTKGHPQKIIGSMRDITARKKAEDELKQSSIFNESLLKTIPFEMDIVDETGTVLFMSDNLKRFFGEDAIGKKCWELYRDDKTQCNGCPLSKGIIIGETEVNESSGVLGGRIFEISHTGMFFNGKKAMLEIFQDVTDKKENEVELIRAKEKAEESDQLKSAFLRNISHEIRTPMNAIVGFASILDEPDIDEQSRQSYIEIIKQSSNHLLAIINDIVEISNIDAHLAKIKRDAINLNSTVRSICDQYAPVSNKKKIQLICEFTIPDSEAQVFTDSTKLVQILTNLINNAIKFTHQGFVRVCIRKKDEVIEFEVSDTGIGIPLAYHQKIFERFYKVHHSNTRLYEGTGLGLAISKANVEMMGGKIWLSSEPGAGSSFFFTIPYEREDNETLINHNLEVESNFVFSEIKTILVAEDVDSNFKLISNFLNGSNTKLIRAINGKEVVKMAKDEKNIDLILMDLKMPEMDGYTAVRLIRKANITIPIIAQTAYADEKEKVFECGCSGFIAKPFNKKSLLKTIMEYI